MKANLLKWGMYILLLSFVSCSSCKKKVEPSPESQLPPVTQTGANTFGALIDGVPWIPNGGGMFSGINPINGGFYGNNTTIFLRTYMNDGRNLQLYVKNVDKKGTYFLNTDTYFLPNPIGNNPNNYGLYTVEANNDIYYMTTSIVTGKIDFTVFDNSNGLLSGTFEFDAIDSNTGKIIKVTNGRFDINSTTLNK